MKNLVKFLWVTFFLLNSLESSGQYLGYSFEELQNEENLKVIERKDEKNFIAYSIVLNDEGKLVLEKTYFFVDNEAVIIFWNVKSPGLLYELIKMYNESEHLQRIAKYKWKNDKRVIVIHEFTDEGAIILAMLNDKEKLKKSFKLFEELSED